MTRPTETDAPQAAREWRFEPSSRRNGVFEVNAAALAREPSSPDCRRFLQRVFSVPEVGGVQIDAPRGLIRIAYPSGEERCRILRDLAAVMRASHFTRGEDVRHLYLGVRDGRPIHVMRVDDTLSTWEIIHRLPGRLRVRHRALPSSAPAIRYVTSELIAMAGVARVDIGARTRNLLIEFDERVVSTAGVLRRLEGVLRELLEPSHVGYQHAGDGLVVPSASVLLAAATDFFAPGLMPASAALLVATNVRNVVGAVGELRRGRPGMATLYSTIMGCTLASGFFFPAALMSWLMHYWDRRYHRQLSVAQRELLQPFQSRPRFAWRQQTDGAELETPIAELRAGDVITVRAGEVLPVDGIVTEGEATAGERHASRPDQLQGFQVGARVTPGAIVLNGWIRVRVEHNTVALREESLAQLLTQATTPPVAPLKSRGAPFARRIVPATLALAGLGFAAGDIGTTLAILRPDYATGSGMTQPMGAVHDVSAALRQGVVVRDPQILQSVAKVDMLVVNHPAPDADARHVLRGLSGRSGCDFQLGSYSTEESAELVEECRRNGQRVAFVGNCAENVDAAQMADVAISWGGVERHASDPAQVFLLEPELTSLEPLWQLARDRQRSRRLQMACTVVPNICCVIGAFSLGFTGIHSVLLTNLGVLAAYRAATRWFSRGSRPTGQ